MPPLTYGIVAAVRSSVLPAGLRAELSAMQQIRSRSGEFAALLSRGPSAIQDLQQQVKDAGAAMMMLKHTSLKHLIREVADLNDCHIVVVSACTGRPSASSAETWQHERWCRHVGRRKQARCHTASSAACALHYTVNKPRWT